MIRILIVASALVLTACGGSGKTSTNEDPAALSDAVGTGSESSGPATPKPVTTGPVTSNQVTLDPVTLEPVKLDPVAQNLTRVDFYIAVPAYVSNKLQIRLDWGKKNILGKWIVDETWTASDNFPTDTEHLLIVTFFDENGAVTLGRFEKEFKTGTNASESYQITAAQFDTTQWDSDGDGVSNLAESIAGTNPLDDGTPNKTSREFDLLANSQDLIRSLAGYPLDHLAMVVDDFAFIIGQSTTMQWPNADGYEVQTTESNATVCDSTAQCEIVPGSYVLVNQSTGERNPLEVPYVSPADQAEATLLPNSSILVEDPKFQPVTVSIDRVQYNCGRGGTMIKEGGTGILKNIPGFDVGRVERLGYVFDQCRVTVRNGLIPADSYLIQGNLQVEQIIANAGWTLQNKYSFEGFSLIGDNGLEYRVTGQIKNALINAAVHVDSRNVMIAEYKKVFADGLRSDSITDVQFNQESYLQSGGLWSSEKLRVDGILRSAQTANQQVVISTESELARQLVLPAVADEFTGVPYNGRVALMVENGSILYVNANPYIDPEAALMQTTPLLDFDYTSSTGERVQKNAVERLHNGAFAPTCWFIRNKITQRLDCANEQEFIVP